MRRSYGDIPVRQGVTSLRSAGYVGEVQLDPGIVAKYLPAQAPAIKPPVAAKKAGTPAR